MDFLGTRLQASAFAFAVERHMGEVRKYTGEAYVCHTLAVARLVWLVTPDDDEAIAAALMHDLIEHGKTDFRELRERFGFMVATYVGDLSNDESKPRKLRKAEAELRIARALPPVQTIKLADILHNENGISLYEGEFADTWFAEARRMWVACSRGHPRLLHAAWFRLEAFRRGFRGYKRVGGYGPNDPRLSRGRGRVVLAEPCGSASTPVAGPGDVAGHVVP
jgi:hypothetical protein